MSWSFSIKYYTNTQFNSSGNGGTNRKVSIFFFVFSRKDTLQFPRVPFTSSDLGKLVTDIFIVDEEQKYDLYKKLSDVPCGNRWQSH